MKFKLVEEINDKQQIKYKKGLQIRLEDNTVINVSKDSSRYRVTGYYGNNNKMFYSPYFNSLKGVANYLLKNFNIELIY